MVYIAKELQTAHKWQYQYLFKPSVKNSLNAECVLNRTDKNGHVMNVWIANRIFTTLDKVFEI